MLLQACHFSTYGCLRDACAFREFSDGQLFTSARKQDAEQPKLLVGSEERSQSRCCFTHMLDYVIENVRIKWLQQTQQRTRNIGNDFRYPAQVLFGRVTSSASSRGSLSPLAPAPPVDFVEWSG